MIYWRLFTYEAWHFTIAATEQGLCYTGSENEGVEQLEQWAKRTFPNEQLQHNDGALADYTAQFLQYFKGQRQLLDFPIHSKGTPFQQTVWEALQTVPYGQTVAYSDIAERIGKRSAVRAVASAIGANPIMISVPCHRVIGKNGKLTGFRGGLRMKERLLKLEQTYIEKISN